MNNEFLIKRISMVTNSCHSYFGGINFLRLTPLAIYIDMIFAKHATGENVLSFNGH